MTNNRNRPDDFLEGYKRQLSEIDGVANAVIQGHFELESYLNDLIISIFFHPDLILGGRFGFEQKVRVVRAMAIRAQDHPHWKVVLAFNELRNAIAHKKPDDDRAKKIDELRRASIRLGRGNSQPPPGTSDIDIVVLGAALGTGFLAVLEEKFDAMRDCLDKVDAELNPTVERVPRKPKSLP